QKKPSTNNSVIPLTPSLASQCGFSMKTDQLGNTVIYASLQNCFAQNVPEDTGVRITTLVFFTPVEKVMKVAEAQRRGYGIANTATRLLLRSPHGSPETYTQNVAGVPMTVLKTSIIFEKKWLATQIDAAAACPSLEGSVSFTPNTISWFLPRHIDPLVSSGHFRLLEVHMGVDGQRLDPAEMAARGYTLSVNDVYIVVEIPIGAVGGYFKSRVQDDHYYTYYAIEPMLEVLWTEETTHEDTRYKVLFPITTPLLSRPPQVIDIPPSVSGGCDHQSFYVLVKYGTLNFQTVVGKRMLTPVLAQQYGFVENGTHTSFAVPFTAPDVVFEAVEGSSIRTRLEVVLRNPETNKIVKEFSMACSFYSTLTECFPNGTMTALAVKLESVPSLNPSQLTLRDPTCRPSYSDDSYAYFVFTGSSCGTTRKFLQNMMLYENEISLPAELEMNRESKADEPEYELKVSCYYDINKTHAVAFHPRPRRSEPYAKNARGELQITMRLALDDSYSAFYTGDDYPIIKYLQQPLYFEVELMRSSNPEVSLELENCWATLDEDRTTQPRWNLLINGCVNPVDPSQVIFHPVLADARARYPSHFKRFEVNMFAFAEDKDNLSRQLFVHCDTVICDARNPLGGVCNGQCSNQENRIKGQRRAVSDGQTFTHVSSGPILVN
uniref:ZP domain-containing protein n=1 Tax=Sparus aurata TaxID=8175 RepID=A0A671VZB9_SPAAU